MADPRARAVAGGRDGVASHAPIAHLCQPQIAFDGAALDKTTHDVYDAILGRCRIDGGAVARERGGRGGEVQAA